jgi:hypothetical protein
MLWDDGLARGYAVAYSTGTKTGEHYNLELGGETAIMVKDRFVTEYGDPDYTIGVGGSGGGIQQYVYAQNHPGLIDAGVPQYSYPDMITQAIHIGDCELLERWIDMELLVGGQTKWASPTRSPRSCHPATRRGPASAPTPGAVSRRSSSTRSTARLPV